jgi:hypothetical protein
LFTSTVRCRRRRRPFLSLFSLELTLFPFADGNTETVPFSRLRPLAAQFKSLEGQAKEATLSFVSLLDWRTEYGLDAMDRFRELCEGQQLVANIDARDANLLHLSLFDPENPASLTGHDGSINVQLVREGLARIDRRSRIAYPSISRALEDASNEAKRGRYGAYELGDVRSLTLLFFPFLLCTDPSSPRSPRSSRTKHPIRLSPIPLLYLPTSQRRSNPKLSTKIRQFPPSPLSLISLTKSPPVSTSPRNHYRIALSSLLLE